MMATTWVMTMTVEEMVAAVVGMAISLQGAEEREWRATHDNQLNDYNAAYCQESSLVLRLGVGVHHARVTVGDLLAIRVFVEKGLHILNIRCS